VDRQQTRSRLLVCRQALPTDLGGRGERQISGQGTLSKYGKRPASVHSVRPLESRKEERFGYSMAHTNGESSR
jgi:hypothetical protein